MWRKPNKRPFLPGGQLEICELCGRSEYVERMIEATAEGLAGRMICPNHGTLGTNPSFNDLGGTGQVSPSQEPLLPHTGTNWQFDTWDAAGDE